LYNGNIAETEWKTKNDNVLRWYKYGYDALNRIIAATDNISRYNLIGMEYDKNGNITNLTRKGHIVANPVSTNSTHFGTMDILAYSYETNSNKLIKVTDAILAIPGDGGFKDGNKSGNDYAYDVNGNMTSDLNKGILAGGIKYNHLNLPDSITLPGGTISYIYDATGVKQKKTVPGKETQYAGNYIYEKIGAGADVLQFFNTAEGYVELNGSGSFNYIYNYVDHLGNVRLSYSDLDLNGAIDPQTEILQERSYYPFGLEHQGYNNVIVGTENNHKTYNGKELEEEFGKNTLAYGWRDYDPAIGRFNKVDRFAEKYYSLSTYSYAGNNPILFVDVQGDSIASGASTRKANRIERRAERRADRVDSRADKREARGQDVADLRERSSELRQSGQDIRDMRADKNNMFRFASVNGREAKNAGIFGPSTAPTGTTESGLNEITLYTEGNMGSQLHETRHGGQHSRGEINAVTQTSSIGAEVSAYRAQYSWAGSLSLSTLDASTLNIRDIQGLNNNIIGQANRTLLNEGAFPLGVKFPVINNIHQVNRTLVNNIVEVGNGGIKGGPNYLLWIYALLR